MAPSQISAIETEKYPGPSQSELGSLADWVSATEFSQLKARPRTARPPSTPPVPPPSHHRRPERYSGPTAQELGDLAAWLGSPKSPRPARRPIDPHSDTTIRAIESELWALENSVVAKQSRPEPRKPTPDVQERPDPDPFLDQLDEIQAALRKRTRA